MEGLRDLKAAIERDAGTWHPVDEVKRELGLQ